MHIRLHIQPTPDNSNLQKKSRKVRFIGRSKQITGIKEIGWGRNASIMHISFQGWQDKYFFFGKGIKKQSLINQYGAKHCI